MSDAVINNIIRSQMVEDYLEFFSDKEIEDISSMIADDCALTDWNVGKIEGKENVIGVFSDIFESVDNIEVEILHIHEDHAGIFTCEMILTIDDTEMLVADIIGFNENDQIKFIRAYKG